MSSSISQALTQALANGYQIDPAAFKIIEAFATKVDPVALVNEAIRLKKSRCEEEQIISEEDLKRALPSDVQIGFEYKEPVRAKGLVVEAEDRMEVIRDVPTTLSPGEGVEGFHSLFKSRFEKLLKIVKQRPDSYQIQRISNLKRNSTAGAKICGLVLERRVKRNSVEMIVDDDTGSIDVVAVDESTRRDAGEVMLDQLVILDLQFTRRGGAIVKSIYSPDIPDHIPKRSEKNVYAILTSDLHVGSKYFLYEQFKRFLLWLSGEFGDEDVVSKISYMIIAGDLVDGLGIYPGQEYELEEFELKKQYKRAAELLNQIPKHIRIVIIPGNHDPVRQALPQPSISKEYAEAIYDLESVTMLGDPAQIRLHGVDVLLYHGKSLDDIIANTPGLTPAKPASAIKILLKARHLAPVYGARTPIAPEVEDHLVIEDVPDIVHAGHIHTVDAEAYRGTLIINSGTWQAQTPYQANMGLLPTPAILPIINLSTLEVLTKNFNMPLIEA